MNIKLGLADKMEFKLFLWGIPAMYDQDALRYVKEAIKETMWRIAYPVRPELVRATVYCVPEVEATATPTELDGYLEVPEIFMTDPKLEDMLMANLCILEKQFPDIPIKLEALTSIEKRTVRVRGQVQSPQGRVLTGTC